MSLRSGESRAETNRRLKRESVLEGLRNKGLIQYVIETAEKLADLGQELDSTEVQRLRAANDARLALIKKYLPDVKQTELMGEDGGDIPISVTVKYV